MSQELYGDSERALPPAKEAVLLESLKEIYPPGYSDLPEANETFEVEIHTRTFWFRKRYIPWIESFTELKDKKILEVGAGTGTSAIPFAERGANIFSIDINPAGIEVAKIRAELHDLSHLAHFAFGNAEQIGEQFKDTVFDMIVYFASLEHMTHAERIKTLRAAWTLLDPGGYLIVVDTPNRLWYFDEHTSLANFFHWLPNELAIDYAKHTPRTGFNSVFDFSTTDADVRMSRWGRGISFHDFQVAIGPIEKLWTSGEWEYRRCNDPVWSSSVMATIGGRYHELMKEICPHLHSAWLESELALALRKPAA
ncbi:class I SAM-dependent methyltransferase [Burkholderia savannae]|uniref:class I SAM-dependent methyltransferase n=1 Tax=Burkholderia savannae TaxID=1637837 RepID=UPI000A810396|nr:class I SAM-dependent methyltransferase [Burkholderia savannae]